MLAQAFDESQTVDQVLLRLRIEACRDVAMSTAPGASSTPGTIRRRTSRRPQFDNTPWRFDMNQNGKRMTADEFDAWMKARGVRVAQGRAAGARPCARGRRRRTASASGTRKPPGDADAV